MIDIDIRLSVADRHRRFDLAVRLQTDAPFVALYGPSGSGKTLTLQAIAGLRRPSAGRIRIADRTLFDAEAKVDLPAAQRGIGYLFQDYALFPHLSVRDNVAFGLRAWHRRRLTSTQAQQVDTLLDSFDLRALADSRPASLSGGQQQRVALARALACEPRLLLLDEPFASLNAILRRTLRTELAALRRHWNIPALMITHDIDDVIALADLVFIVEGGRIIRSVDLRQTPIEAIAARVTQAS